MFKLDIQPNIELKIQKMKVDLINTMAEALNELYRWPEDTVQIFHHNDTDGLTSGAILTEAFKRKGYNINRFCLEKPYPQVLKKVFKDKGRIFIFADFAGGIAKVISKLNRGRSLVLILDHHVAEKSNDRTVKNLDPDLFGLKGDRDISASTTCYLFATAMDPKNRDLASLATLGALGDEFLIDGRLVSENRRVTMEACKQGMVKIEEKERGERYIFKFSKRSISGRYFSAYLDILGGVGYYGNGPLMGVKVCIEGFSEESDKMVDRLKLIKDELFNSEIERLKGGTLKGGALKVTDHIQWFHVEDRFSPMGAKMIGTLCNKVKNMDFIDQGKYIAGFQVIRNEVPDFGSINFNEVKISMRVSALLEEKIRAGETMGLNILLPEATKRTGGFCDACHTLTAASTVKIGREESLIEEMEKILAH